MSTLQAKQRACRHAGGGARPANRDFMLADMMAMFSRYELHLAAEGGPQDVGMFVRSLCCHFQSGHSVMWISPLLLHFIISLAELSTNATIVL